jgi:hypothetical protein
LGFSEALVAFRRKGFQAFRDLYMEMVRCAPWSHIFMGFSEALVAFRRKGFQAFRDLYMEMVRCAPWSLLIHGIYTITVKM